MKALFVSVIAALTFASAATAAKPYVPKAPSLTLDSFDLSPEVKYLDNNFWCEYNNYGLYFTNYDGRCPYQDYVATVRWTKVPDVTEYDVCATSVFRDYSPGFACWVLYTAKGGNPTSRSWTFDSAYLNPTQGTTQVWTVKACRQDISLLVCSEESNAVSAQIPWTG